MLMQTVSSITVNDGFAEIPPTRYSYSGGAYDFPEREFRGFASVTQTNPNVTQPNLAGTQVETRFHQDLWCKGRQDQVLTKDSSTTHATLGITDFSWECPATTPAWAFIKLNQKRTDLIENNASTAYTLETYLYDAIKARKGVGFIFRPTARKGVGFIFRPIKSSNSEQINAKKNAKKGTDLFSPSLWFIHELQTNSSLARQRSTKHADSAINH